MDKKIVDPAFVSVLSDELHRRNSKIVFTNGVFDLLHPGHVQYLSEARRLGTDLIVGVNTDESVRQIKGDRRPIVPLDARMEVLAALECVDYVTWFTEDTPANLIRLVKPDVLVKGGDWTPDRIVGRDFVEARGGSVLSIPLQEGYSTSSIIERIRKL